MYKDLRTNLPKEIMAYPDFPFEPKGNSYLHHSEVQRYLDDYARHFGLTQFIEFQTRVVSVKPVEISEGSKTTWCVTTQDVPKGQVQTRFWSIHLESLIE